MPSFVPRTAEDCTENIIARAVGRSTLTDTLDGSVLYGILRPVGEEIAYGDFRTWQVRNSFNFLTDPDISLEDLKERLLELPGTGMALLEANQASGPVMSISRKSSVGLQTLPAGTTFGRDDGSPLVYRTVADIKFVDGAIAVSGAYVVCVQPGIAGNCGTGVITRTLSAPSWVLGCTNTDVLTNGFDAESIPQAQNRGKLYMSALCGSQRAAIEYLALSFRASDGSRTRFAKGFYDPLQDHFAELVVDDAFAGLINPPNAALTGVVPTGGQTTIAHEGPATDSLQYVNVLRADGQTTDQLTEYAGQCRSMFEFGYFFVPANKSWSLSAGDTWTLPQFSTYSGYIAELQRLVCGDVNNQYAVPGWEAFGCRVVVRPAGTFLTGFDIHVVPVSGVQLEIVQNSVTNVVLAMLANQGPGQPLFVSDLIAAAKLDPNILDIKFYEPNTSPYAPKGDVYPPDKQCVRTTLAMISFFQGTA